MRKNLHISKKSSTFVQLLRGANGEPTPQAKKPSGSAAPNPKEKTDKSRGNWMPKASAIQPKAQRMTPDKIGGARCESLRRPKEKNGRSRHHGEKLPKT